MLNRLRTYSRFVKIEHSVFALPLVFAGVVIGAGGWPTADRLEIPLKFSWPLELGLIVMAAIGARTVAFAFNRIFDSKIDALNPRTAQRELPAGAMTTFEAWGVGILGACVYFASAFALMNTWGLILGLVPLVVFAIYPLLKRFTSLAHFGVGLSLALAPLAGWLAVVNLSSVQFYDVGTGAQFRHISISIDQVGWLALFTFFWVSGFDIIYSTMDEEFDRAQKLHSLPAKLGRKKALWVSTVLHTIAFVTLGVIYASYYRTPAAGVLLGAAGVLLFLEQYLAEQVDLAFFKINAVLSFVILAFVWTGVVHL